jgi:microcin C transport system permease protein
VGRYILRRLLLIIPTLWAIITLNFFITQIAPGGPVDEAIAKAQGRGTSMAMQRLTGQGSREVTPQGGTSATGKPETNSLYRGARGLDPQVVAEIRKRFGFDKPLLQRYGEMLLKYLQLDFGDSLFRGQSVVTLIVQSLPVSISLGVWSTLLTYLVCIPMGIRKAVKNGTRFDLWTSTVILVGSAIPQLLFAVLLIILFAGGSYLQLFPLRGLVSNNWSSMSFFGKIGDYLWHMVLPISAEVIGGFASLTMLTKNSYLDEVNKQYVLTARAKGLTERAILRKHVFRNAMLLVIAGFPSAFIGMFFAGSLIIETTFSLNGLGLLGYDALLQRDYPVIFATLYMFTLLGLLLTLVGDLTYTLVDPRIDFETRKT